MFSPVSKIWSFQLQPGSFQLQPGSFQLQPGTLKQPVLNAWLSIGWCNQIPDLYIGNGWKSPFPSSFVHWLFRVPGTPWVPIWVLHQLKRTSSEWIYHQILPTKNPMDLPCLIGASARWAVGNRPKKMCCPRGKQKTTNGTYSLTPLFVGRGSTKTQSEGSQNRFVGVFEVPKGTKGSRNIELSSISFLFFPKQRVPWPNCMACIILGSNNQQTAKIIDARRKCWNNVKKKTMCCTWSLIYG